jgi:hypothetical protein
MYCSGFRSRDAGAIRCAAKDKVISLHRVGRMKKERSFTFPSVCTAGTPQYPTALCFSR